VILSIKIVYVCLTKYIITETIFERKLTNFKMKIIVFSMKMILLKQGMFKLFSSFIKLVEYKLYVDL